MTISKAALRTYLHAARRSINPHVRYMKDAAITEQLFTAHDWSMTRRLHLYDSTIDEVDTHSIHSLLAAFYPHITIDVGPVSAHTPVPTTPYDVIIVPTLGYDVSGNRLGLGAGWYDKFLAIQPTARHIGLAYNECQVAYLPVEAHDQPLDFIIAA